MGRRWPGWAVLPALLIPAPAVFTPAASAQATRAADESFFVEQLHPVLHAVQCEQCHNDNGVASETRLDFPGVDAGKAQIEAFGLS